MAATAGRQGRDGRRPPGKLRRMLARGVRKLRIENSEFRMKKVASREWRMRNAEWRIRCRATARPRRSLRFNSVASVGGQPCRSGRQMPSGPRCQDVRGIADQLAGPVRAAATCGRPPALLRGRRRPPIAATRSPASRFRPAVAKYQREVTDTRIATTIRERQAGGREREPAGAERRPP